MSLLSGIISGVKATYSYLSGDSYGATLVKTIALGYGLKELTDSVNKDNNAPSKNIDKGVRLQIPPANDNKIPILYGSAYFGGIISDAEMTSDNKTMYYVLTLSERTGNKYSVGTATSYTFDDVYWNDQRVVFRADGITVDYSVDKQGNIDRSLSGYVKIYHYAGNSSSGQAPDGYTATIPNAADVMPSWAPATHTMSDLIFAVVKVDYNRERNITGIGDLKFKVTSDMMLPGDCLYDYMTNEMYGAGIEASKLNQAQLAELNTYSSESVAYIDDATGVATLPNRYQINGLLDTGEKVLTNAEKIASAAATWISYDIHNGEWTFVINRPMGPVAVFNDSNILGNISLQGTGIKELYNKVKVEFPHRDLRDSADYRGIAIPVADRNANEVSNQLGISYDIINEPVQAEILGLIELKQTRIDVMISFQTDYSYISLNAGDVIMVTNASFGFSSKKFRIVTVEEKQDDAGALVVDILAVAYDADVYDVSDLTRYVRSDEDGIITIGSIGTPGFPTVTKFQQSSRPRIVVSTNTPSGIVDGLEYWLSNDVTLLEENRSYRLVGERRPSEAETFPSGTPVDLTLDSLPSSDFVIKVRAFNSLTVSPYTNPTGLVEYRPVQTTDAISPDTDVLDALGNVAIALTAIDLLKGLDDLYQGLTGNESVFDVIFDKFEQVTGVDLVGQASGGSLVVEAELATLDNGTLVANKTNSYNFVGQGVGVTVDVDQNVEIDLGQAVLPSGSSNKDILAWNEVDQEWQLIPNCITCDFPQPPPEPNPGEPGGPPIPCSLTINNTLPADKGTWAIAGCGPTSVPYNGPYYVVFNEVYAGVVDGVDLGTVPYYDPLQLGSGSISLYTSDGTLQQSILATSCTVRGNNVLEIPFGARDPGTDYYILMDEGIVTACECSSSAITDPTVWNFTTNPLAVPQYAMPNSLPSETFDFGSFNYSDLTITSITPNNSEFSCNSRAITITFSEAVAATGQNIYVYEVLSGTEVAVISSNSFTINGNVATSAPVTAFQNGNTYEIFVGSGAFTTVRPDVTRSDSRCSISATETRSPPQSTSVAQGAISYIKPTVEYWFLTICSEQAGGSVTNLLDKTNRLSNLELTFTGPISIKESSPANLHIYNSSGALHQTIDLRGSFPQESELYQILSDRIRVNPTRMFDLLTEYYVLIDDGVVLDECGNHILINDPNQVTFKTEGIEFETTENTPPTSFNEDGSQNVGFELDLQNYTTGTGLINVYDEQGTLVKQLAADDPAITYSSTI